MSDLPHEAMLWLNSVMPNGHEVAEAGRHGVYVVTDPDGSTTVNEWTGSQEELVWMMLDDLQDSIQVDSREVWPPSAKPSVPKVEASEAGTDIGYADEGGWVLRHHVPTTPAQE